MERTLDFRDHRRELGDNRYVYAVVSRRARGLSIGINLNPDKVCNFDCPYCQVDRRIPGGSAEVDVARLSEELEDLLDRVVEGDLWETPPFHTVDPALQRVADIAFAGDGEPTSPREFAAAAAAVRTLRDRMLGSHGEPPVPLRLITNSTLLHREAVRAGLDSFDELWCKLDAGTEAWFRRVDGTTFPFSRILRNLHETVTRRPIVIQSMFVALGDDAPDDAEIAAWTGHLRDLAAAGTVSMVQVYTLARPPADLSVRALSPQRLAEIAAAARAVGVPAQVY